MNLVASESVHNPAKFQLEQKSPGLRRDKKEKRRTGSKLPETGEISHIIILDLLFNDGKLVVPVRELGSIDRRRIRRKWGKCVDGGERNEQRNLLVDPVLLLRESAQVVESVERESSEESSRTESILICVDRPASCSPPTRPAVLLSLPPLHPSLSKLSSTRSILRARPVMSRCPGWLSSLTACAVATAKTAELDEENALLIFFGRVFFAALRESPESVQKQCARGFGTDSERSRNENLPGSADS